MQFVAWNLFVVSIDRVEFVQVYIAAIMLHGSSLCGKHYRFIQHSKRIGQTWILYNQKMDILLQWGMQGNYSNYVSIRMEPPNISIHFCTSRSNPEEQTESKQQENAKNGFDKAKEVKQEREQRWIDWHDFFYTHCEQIRVNIYTETQNALRLIGSAVNISAYTQTRIALQFYIMWLLFLNMQTFHPKKTSNKHIFTIG